MNLTATSLEKKFNNHRIFSGIDLSLAENDSLAVTGSNGSGKSTLLKCLAGFVQPSSGAVHIKKNGQAVEPDRFHHYIAIAAPYLELIEEYTLVELIRFQQQFKPFLKTIDADNIPGLLHLEKHKNKQVKAFSSGMKQRAKLGLALFSSAKILYLDEPASNLDEHGIAWYKENMEKFCGDRITVICSNNNADEIFLCKTNLNIEAYK